METGKTVLERTSSKEMEETVRNSKINRKSSTIWLNLTFTGASRKGRISQRFFITTKKNVPKLPQEKQYA